MTNDNRTELHELSHELVQLRYSMDHGKLEKVFSNINFMDYVLLTQLTEKMGLSVDNKVYLKEIVTTMNMPISAISKMVTHLNDAGYVYWKHEDKGHNGTYILLSETGDDAIKTQKNELLEYSRKIADRFGYEKTRQILMLLKDLEEVLHEDEDIIDLE